MTLPTPWTREQSSWRASVHANVVDAEPTRHEQAIVKAITVLGELGIDTQFETKASPSSYGFNKKCGNSLGGDFAVEVGW